MKRAVLLAVALAAVPLTASHAQATEGRPQHDREALIDFAREHGETAAVGRADLGRGLTQDGLFDACQVQNLVDPSDGLNVDVVSFSLAHDCGTGTWALGLGASASFNANTFDTTVVFLDTDMNAGTGDLGDDYAVVALFDDNDVFNLAVIRTPTSNSATWSMTGTPGFYQSQNLLSLIWRHSEIGSPAQFRWKGEFSTLVDAGIDLFPNAGYVTTTTPSLPPGPALGQPGKFVPVTPTRIMDTRAGGAASKPFASSTLRHTVAGVAPVPADAIAVALNVTATEAEGSGFVTVFPNGPSRPFVSNLNFTSGQNIANLVVSPIGSQGKVSFYTHQPTHLVADVMGYWVPAASSADGRYQPLQPARILDTRAGTKPGPFQTIPFAVSGQGGVPASGVSAVVLNLTLTESTASGWAAAFPGGTAWSGASNLNVQGAGKTVPNLVIVPVGANGMVNLLTLTGGHLVADVAGYFTDGTAPATSSGLFVSQQPFRIVDTRPGQPTGGGAPQAKIPTGQSIQVSTAPAGIPPGAGAALLNVTNTENNFAGFVTVYPAEPRPFASNLNMDRANHTVPNSVVATLNAGTFRVYSHPGSHVIVDTAGYFTA